MSSRSVSDCLINLTISTGQLERTSTSHAQLSKVCFTLNSIYHFLQVNRIFFQQQQKQLSQLNFGSGNLRRHRSFFLTIYNRGFSSFSEGFSHGFPGFFVMKVKCRCQIMMQTQFCGFQTQVSLFVSNVQPALESEGCKSNCPNCLSQKEKVRGVRSMQRKEKVGEGRKTELDAKRKTCSLADHSSSSFVPCHNTLSVSCKNVRSSRIG